MCGRLVLCEGARRDGWRGMGCARCRGEKDRRAGSPGRMALGGLRRERGPNGAVYLAVGMLLLLSGIHVAARAEAMGRHAGYIQSLRPSDRTLLIDKLGGGGAARRLEVRIRNAEVVRVWRDPANPWVRRERGTTIYQWPVGTFVVVIGHATPSGAFEATRIEIPKISSE